MASNEIFNAFSSPEKSDALLHGHSYTAHAVGCKVATDSLQTMMNLERNGSWDKYRDDWKVKNESTGQTVPDVWSVWSHGFVRDLSHAESVDGVFAIGTVLSISLRDAKGGGTYISPFLTCCLSPRPLFLSYYEPTDQTNSIIIKKYRLHLHRSKRPPTASLHRHPEIQRPFQSSRKRALPDGERYVQDGIIAGIGRVGEVCFALE